MLLSDRETPCNGIKFYEDSSFDLDERYDNLMVMPNDDALLEYLKKQRNINFGKKLNNKEWNLFLFNKRNNQPVSIDIVITTYGRDGDVILRQKI